MKKRITALIVLCCLFLSLFCGCDIEDQKKSSESSTPQISQTKDDSTPESKPTLTEGRTLFIYMCGSDLETKQGLASKNIDELLSSDAGDMNIVIQTGGAKTWRHHDISSTETQRYEINDGKLELLKSFEQKNMGEAETLTDFLKWGQENYPTDHNMLILWDHGGGSAKGVCFDENYSFDALTLTELNSALKNANLNSKFDIIGFDACLMASIETAAVVQDYAKYMIASEEIVPSGGWDYKSVVEAFASGKNEKIIGRQICDSFMEKCKKSNKDDISTLSLVNLSELNPIFDHLDSLGKSLSEFVGKDNAFSKVISAAKRCEKFGYDSVFSGSSNMIDYLDFGKLVVLSDFDAYSKVYDIVEEAVVYSVRGEQRDNGGISFYYPIDYDEKEMTEYISLGISEPYNKFLSTYYLNAPDETIAFSDKGSVAKNEAFRVSLTPESVKYLSTVTYNLIEKDEDGAEYILFSDVDIDSDWDSLTFTSDFKGKRRLYNGHQICYTPVRIEETLIEYSAPISINGRKANMHYYCYPEIEADGRYYAPRNLSSMKENWLPNEFYNPWEGDIVQVAECLRRNGDEYIAEYGEEFEPEELKPEDLFSEITEVPLSGKTYYYIFVATDIFGNEYYSDMATMKMKYTYDELLKNPLPDRTPAADIISIAPCDIENTLESNSQ